MVSNRNTFQRRRSQSATTASVPRRSVDDAYRVATKRAHPHRSSSSSSSSSSDTSSSSKWDLDIWRHGKRRRREVSPTWGGSEMDVDQYTSIPSTSNGVMLRPTALPSTPAAFQLFPRAGRRTTKTRRFTCHSDSGAIALSDRGDIDRLRSNAFWELHQSVAESGEGFVRRMRDYENSRTRSERCGKTRESPIRGKKRASISSPPPPTRLDQMSDCSDEDDDVQILDGALNAVGIHQWPNPSSTSGHLPDRTQVPRLFPALPGDSNSSCLSDDEENLELDASSVLPLSPTHAASESSLMHTPALTHAQTNSATSSLVSLPLLPSETRPSSPRPVNQILPVYPASRTDKAIAALSLALANGAAGLNDYATLQALQMPLAMDECHVGEMWD